MDGGDLETTCYDTQLPILGRNANYTELVELAVPNSNISPHKSTYSSNLYTSMGCMLLFSSFLCLSPKSSKAYFVQKFYTGLYFIKVSQAGYSLVYVVIGTRPADWTYALQDNIRTRTVISRQANLTYY
jgi:hypothetical protein